MSIQFLGPFNKISNETATEVINVGIVHKAEDIIVTVLNSSLNLVDTALVKGPSLTAPEPEPAPEPTPEEP